MLVAGFETEFLYSEKILHRGSENIHVPKTLLSKCLYAQSPSLRRERAVQSQCLWNPCPFNLNCLQGRQLILAPWNVNSKDCFLSTIFFPSKTSNYHL